MDGGGGGGEDGGVDGGEEVGEDDGDDGGDELLPTRVTAISWRARPRPTERTVSCLGMMRVARGSTQTQLAGGRAGASVK